MKAQSVAQGFHPGGLKIPKIAEASSEIVGGGGGGVRRGLSRVLNPYAATLISCVWVYDIFHINTYPVMHI